MLRLWQDECINIALIKYQQGQSNFLAMATPGAGKTWMAAHLASRLFELDKIDLVVCFAPSINVTNSFQENLEKVTEKRMNGRMGSSGQVMTYHHLTFLSGSFWKIFQENRVFVIFDEIHHCSGQDINLSNAWGERILINIRSKAAYTLALSGTPWRSDKLPIALARYSGDPKRLECDYIYPLAQAVRDGVCRIPKIVAIDNDNIRYTNTSGGLTHHNTLRELLSDTNTTYADLLYNESIITFTLQQAINRLQSIRQYNPRAAGLIVASSIQHAHWIFNILAHQLGQSAMIVTHQYSESQDIIENFEDSHSQWIIAIGMVSEGTNIPRLQVCCYLSRIKTELYFRQVLGRIVRAKEEPCPYAYLYTLAEENLLEYARRIGDDLPEHLATVEFQHITEETTLQEDILDNPQHELGTTVPTQQPSNDTEELVTKPLIAFTDEDWDESLSTQIPSSEISLFGQFFEELITLQYAFNKVS
jgi:superfamily II DNA or RNA helicase